MWKRTLDYNFNWGQALRRAAASSHAGYKDWRIPNIKELESLVEEKCQDPAINTTVFPNAPSYFVWASSPYPGRADEALTIDLRDGASREETRDNNYVVWLVRGGP